MLLYITFVDFRAFFAQGVHRKIQGQVKAMERQLDKVYYMGWSYPKLHNLVKGKQLEKERENNQRRQEQSRAERERSRRNMEHGQQT